MPVIAALIAKQVHGPSDVDDEEIEVPVTVVVAYHAGPAPAGEIQAVRGGFGESPVPCIVEEYVRLWIIVRVDVKPEGASRHV